jgi:transglutaminase-like putative cysteine protease
MASHRRTLAAAIATIAASLSLYPIFYGSLWFIAGIASVLVVAAAGTATRVRRLPWPVALAGGLVALLLWLNLAFSNARSLWHLLPTPASIAALAHLVSVGFAESSKYAPPVPELRGMVLLAAAGIGITALLTDLIAVRLQSAALAGLPLLLLFTEPFTLSVSRGFVGTTVAFVAGVAGYLALLSSEGRDRIREWEQPDPDAMSAPDTRPLAAAGRRVGFASVVIALCLPLFLPGLHVTRLFGGQPGIGGDAGGGSGGGVAVGFPSPDSQISSDLHDAKASTVLTYTSTAGIPDYLQLYVADDLTDHGWGLFTVPEALVPASPKLPPAPGLTSDLGLSKVTTTITIASGVGQDQYSALPVPYPATTVTAPGTVDADRTTLMVVDPGITLSNLHYSVTSLSNDPPVSQLEAAAAPPASIADHYLEVPTAYDSLKALAESVVTKAKATNQFTEAVALQNWLSGGTFKYTLSASSVENAAQLSRFLKVTKAGYCQQFAYAMAVLARLLGIPSRVAYGFTSGTPDGTDWVVTTHDAHAWPELYFQGYGWLRFEPTPSGDDGQGTATAPQYTIPLSNSGAAPNLGTATAAPTPSAASTSPNPALAHLIGNGFDNGAGAGAAGGASAGGLSAWELLGLVIAGLVVLAAVAPWLARLVVRKRRWYAWRLSSRRHSSRRHSRRPASRPGGDADDSARNSGDVIDSIDTAGDDDSDGLDVAWAHAAWCELRDDLVDHGTGYLPSESPRAAAVRAGTSLALAEPALAALRRIAMAEERARYAARPVDGSGLRRDSTTVRRAIAAAVPRRTRWRARLLPSSVVGPALGTAAAAADIFGRLNPEWPSRFRGGRANRQNGQPSADKLNGNADKLNGKRTS